MIKGGARAVKVAGAQHVFNTAPIPRRQGEHEMEQVLERDWGLCWRLNPVSFRGGRGDPTGCC